jgi:hypothetical protein
MAILTFLVDPSENLEIAYGNASKMGKVVASLPSFKTSAIQGGFKADINAVLKLAPEGISGPNSVLKKFVR